MIINSYLLKKNPWVLGVIMALKNEIPPGDEHLYVLKSEIVPPVCPKCPESTCSSGKNGKNGGGAKEDCPPCPRPQRCPEPAFTCKKVLIIQLLL